MSYVICVAMENQAIIMGDGRAINGANIATEHYKKVMRLSDHIIIGFTGIGEICQTAIAHIRQGIMVDSHSVALALQEYTHSPFGRVITSKCAFVVVSKDIFGKVHVATYHMKTDSVKFHDPAEGAITLVALSPDNIDGYEILKKHMQAPSDNILKSMQDAIVEVSQLDFSVNKNITWCAL